MEVKEVEIVLKSDGWWRFACGDVFFMKNYMIIAWINISYLKIKFAFSFHQNMNKTEKQSKDALVKLIIYQFGQIPNIQYWTWTDTWDKYIR